MKGWRLLLGLIALVILTSVLGGKSVVKAGSPEDLMVNCIPDYTEKGAPTYVYLSDEEHEAVPGISWDAGKRVLTLNGYKGGPIDIVYFNDDRSELIDVEIRVIGENIIHSLPNLEPECATLEIYNANAKITGTGSLTVESQNATAGENIDVCGDLTIDGPTINVPDTYDAISCTLGTVYVFDEDGEKKIEGWDEDEDGRYPVYEMDTVGGNITVKSGNVRMSLKPAEVDSYTDDEVWVKKLKYQMGSAIFAVKDINITGGRFVIDMDWPNKVDCPLFEEPDSFIYAHGKINVSNSTVIVTVADKIKNIPVFLVPYADLDDEDYKKDSNGCFITDPTKTKIDSSVAVFKGKYGEKASISTAEITLAENSFVFDGTEKKPAVTVKGLQEGTDYTVSYSNNTNIGTAAVIITGKGDLSGTATTTFNITAPKKGKIFTKGKLKYKITKAPKGKTPGAVTVVGPVKKTYKSVVIPDYINIGEKYNVTAIGPKAFMNNKKLEKVTIGKNVTTIGAQAFAGCTKLKTIIIKTSKLNKVGGKAFRGIKKNASFKVPKKMIKKYRSKIRKAKASKGFKVTK